MPDLPLEAWAYIRHDYECTDRPVEEICAEHGISSGTLRDRMRRWKWTRRRPPIPEEGPAPMPWPARGAPDSPAPQSETLPAVAPAGAAEPPAPSTSSEDAAAPVAPDPAAVAQRLQGAVARVLPAIEATVGRLTAGATQPRELERAARTLTALTRTLRELDTLLEQHPPPAEWAPRNLDEARASMARKIDAIIAQRKDREAAAAAAEFMLGPNDGYPP